ncbi:hypothetical protein [uncultured Polaribacter sp.]|uniref:hypothetical protein n=1 Tax=uncultured Polaribacter sp. TaxID=174711 RepID=UPI00261B9C4F|nr:hypothetical protein [uncultured Polaribacter sp.]
MKRILLILVLFITTIALSQEKTFEQEVSKISKRIEHITKTQKDSLKLKVISIDKKIEKKEMTKTIADTLKKEAASYHARRIEKLISEQERLLQLLVQDKTNGKIASSEDTLVTEVDNNTFTVGNKTFHLKINNRESVNASKQDSIKNKNHKKNRSTTTQFVFAMGVNNVLEDGQIKSLNNSEYKLWKSRFYEVGWTWKTRINKKPGSLYFKYGISFLWNNLRLDKNQYHIKKDDITEIQVFDNQLTESRLRHVQMNFPIHFEWDLSKNSKHSNSKVLGRKNKPFRIGLGGFTGFKLGTRQYLNYTDVNGVDQEVMQKNNFNMNTINYGLSAYLGYKSASLYVKYDLNPLFKKTSTRNISMGIRLDLN